MKRRLFYLVRLYLLLLAVFVVQKPLFLWLDAPEGSHYGIGDLVGVMANGLLLDIPVTGYLIALPLLFVVASCWIPKALPLRTIASAYYAVVAFAVSVVFVVDASLYPFWKFKLDTTIFIYMDSPKNVMASVSFLYIAWRVVCIVAYGLLLFLLLRVVTPKSLSPVGTVRGRVLSTALLVAAMVPLAISIRGGVGESTANIGKVYFSDNENLNHSAVNPCFSMIASLGKADNYEDEFDFYEEGERERLFAGLYDAGAASDTISLLTTKRPNVIVIIMEGFGGQFLECVSGRTDIAPNYNRLAREGVLFTHCYSNSFRTDRGTVSTLSGYPAFPTLSVMKLPIKSRTLPCIASTLNAEGYNSSFLYGGDINFTNMQSYLRTGGYGTIVSDVDFGASDRKDNPWGANDDKTFDRLFQMAMEQGQEPWHIGYLTLSSHEPWKVPYNRLDEEIPNAFAFTDDCLGRFVGRIRKTPLWNNLLIVCIPDHGYQYPADISHEQHHHNAMLWIGGAVRRPVTVGKLMNQSDMAATLLAQLGIDHSRYTFSRDVLSPSYVHPFAFFTFKEGFGLVDSTGCTVYGINADRAIEDRPVSGSAENRLKRAKAIMQSFYDDLGAR